VSDNIPQDLLQHFYRPFCSEEEISAIFNVQSSDDYLLKTRADYVADHVRLYRVMRRRMAVIGAGWSFSDHFAKEEFNNYLRHLSNADRESCSTVSGGYVFTTDPNGMCVASPFGTVVMVSEALRYFLFHMSLAHFDHGIEVPGSVRLHAQMIAIRVMLESESLDFDLDPRGRLPDGLEKLVSASVEASLEFVIGHEYSHYLLGHLAESSLISRVLAHGDQSGDVTRPHHVYSFKQQLELDADIDAVCRVQGSADYAARLVYGAIVFFAFLDLFTFVKDQIAPVHDRSRSHPDAIDRLWNMFDAFGERYDIGKSYVDGLIELVEHQKDMLRNDVALNIDNYEDYGSVYLAEWRGPELIDRVDYYF
jgi:hypothetical protein